jgi:hypothetical protein
MPRLNLVPRREHACHHRQASGAINLFGLHLVHRQCRSEHPGMRVGNAQPLQNALNAAILAPAAMQGVEADGRLDVSKACRQIGAAIDPRHLVTSLPQGLGAFAPRDKRHLPLRGKPTHQNRHFGGHPARCARHTLPHPELICPVTSLFLQAFSDPHDFPL